jgi:hypothetical protein
VFAADEEELAAAGGACEVARPVFVRGEPRLQARNSTSALALTSLFVVDMEPGQVCAAYASRCKHARRHSGVAHALSRINETKFDRRLTLLTSILFGGRHHGRCYRLPYSNLPDS